MCHFLVHVYYIPDKRNCKWKNIDTSVASPVMKIMQALKVDGMGNNDQGSLVQYYENSQK